MPPCWHAARPGRLGLVLVVDRDGGMAVLEVQCPELFPTTVRGEAGMKLGLLCVVRGEDSRYQARFQHLVCLACPLFCLRFPQFLRGTLVDEPPVKDWCLPGTVCHQSHPQSFGALGWQRNHKQTGFHQCNYPNSGKVYFMENPM